MFLFLSQICSCPIQIYSCWIQISQRRQWSKTQNLYTDKRQMQVYFHKVCFFMYLTLPMNPLLYVLYISNYNGVEYAAWLNLNNPLFLDCSSNYIVRNLTCSHLPGAKGASNFIGLKILEWTCLYEFGNTNSYVLCDPLCIAKNEGMYKLVSINWSIIRVSHERNVLTDIFIKEDSSSTNSRWFLLFRNCNQLIY